MTMHDHLSSGALNLIELNSRLRDHAWPSVQCGR